MLVYITEHQPTYLVVHKVDRLSRSVADDVMILSAVKQAGTSLVSVSENIDDTPQGHLMHGIQAVIAEFCTNNLVSEVVKGTEQKVLAGGTPPRAPIGYRNVGKIVGYCFEERSVEPDANRVEHIT